MATKKGTNDAERRTTKSTGASAPDDFPVELLGEFAELPEQLVKNIGTIAGASVAGGGYFGISVTDDGDSCRLAVRSGLFVLDKRFGSIAKLEGALAYCARKLADLG